MNKHLLTLNGWNLAKVARQVFLLLFIVTVFGAQIDSTVASDHVDEHINFDPKFWFANKTDTQWFEQSTPRDLTDIFVWVNHAEGPSKGKLVVALNANNEALSTTRFDDTLTYEIVIKPVDIFGASQATGQFQRNKIPKRVLGPKVKQGPNDKEIRISCKFSPKPRAIDSKIIVTAKPKEKSSSSDFAWNDWASWANLLSNISVGATTPTLPPPTPVETVDPTEKMVCVLKTRRGKEVATKGHYVEANFNQSSTGSYGINLNSPKLPFFRAEGSTVVTDVNRADIVGRLNQTLDAPVKLFAGLRADPFILSLGWAGFTLGARILAPVDVETAKSDLSPQNVLNIVLELDLPKLIGTTNKYFAVYGEILPIAGDTSKKIRNSDPPVPVIRWDRVGRPELTNMTIAVKEAINEKEFEQRNDPNPKLKRYLGPKQQYNLEDTLNLTNDGIVQFSELISKGINFWDGLGGEISGSPATIEWLAKDDSSLKQGDPILDDFTDSLLDDYIVVNTTHSCPFYTLPLEARTDTTDSIEAAEGSDLTKNQLAQIKAVAYAKTNSTYLEIELGAYQNPEELENDTLCGGRMPNDDIIDVMVSAYIGGPKADPNSWGDGVYHNSKSAKKQWPFFAAPNPDPKVEAVVK